jgi:hypothetical protein
MFNQDAARIEDVASVAHYQWFKSYVQECWTYFGHTLAALFHQVYCRAGGPALRDPGYPPEDTKEAIEILTILKGCTRQISWS